MIRGITIQSFSGRSAVRRPLRPAPAASVAGLLLLVVGAGVAAAESAPQLALDAPGWELTRDEDGIRSYKRVVTGSPLLAFRGEAVIKAPITRVLSVALDTERVGEWIPGVAESTVVRWIKEPVEYVQYSRFDAPWPVRDRIFLSRVVMAVDPHTYTTEIRYHNIPETLDRDRGIQGYTGGSYYILRPFDQGRSTYFVGVSVADPRGSVPAWLVNWMGASWAHRTLRLLARQVAKPDVSDLPMIEPLFAGFEPSPPSLSIPEMPTAGD